MFKIQNFTKVQLNFGKTQNKKFHDIELNNVYCYNKFLKPYEPSNVQDYINKYISKIVLGLRVWRFP